MRASMDRESNADESSDLTDEEEVAKSIRQAKAKGKGRAGTPAPRPSTVSTPYLTDGLRSAHSWSIS